VPVRRRERLEGDISAEGEVAGEVYHAHAAAGEFPTDFVPIGPTACRDGIGGK
jgi:hypothetical protein